MDRDVSALGKPSKLLQDTGLDTAYFRSLSDIPNAKLVSDMIGAGEAFSKGTAGTFDSVRTIIPGIEGRYKAVDTLIRRSGIRQVVEIAAGRTTRGMNNPQWNYLHTDYSEGMLMQMLSVTNRITRGDHGNVHFVRFDAVTGEGIEEVLGFLDDGPTVVVHEGLLMYYPRELQERIATNARRILELHGGIYIAPDVRTREHPSFAKLYPQYASRRQEQGKRMGRDLNSFRFGSDAEAVSFFEGLGFEVEIMRYEGLVGHLKSMEVLFPDEHERGMVWDVIRRHEVWRMALRGKGPEMKIRKDEDGSPG